MEKKEKQKILDYEDTCNYLKVSRVTLWKYQKAGLRSRKVGGETFFFKKDLQAWDKPKRGKPSQTKEVMKT